MRTSTKVCIGVITVLIFVGFICLRPGSVLTDFIDRYLFDKYLTTGPVLEVIDKIMKKARKYNKIDPVVSMHLNDLKARGLIGTTINASNIGQIARSMVVRRATGLNHFELDRLHMCTRNIARKRGNAREKFFGKYQNVRRTHHSYLRKDKIMIELGGNWGDDSGNFSLFFNPRMIILEPLRDYVRLLEKKFYDNSQVVVYQLGLGAANEKLWVKVEGNNACATSKFSNEKGNVQIIVANAIKFFTYLGVGVYEIDLLTMNCEGCEYEVLETLLKTNLVTKFRNIQWGTHSTLEGIKNPINRYCRIVELLSRTHKPTYRFHLIWENWRRNDIL